MRSAALLTKNSPSFALSQAVTFITALQTRRQKTWTVVHVPCYATIAMRANFITYEDLPRAQRFERHCAEALRSLATEFGQTRKEGTE
jgi:hypothetical protein